MPGPACSAECAVGPPAVLFGSEINATKCYDLPPKGKRGCILLSPQRIVAPVGGEVLLLTGICGTDGSLQVAEPIEWMLTPDSVGTIIDVGDDAPGLVHRLAGVQSARKQDPGFARGVTSTKRMLITRGNTNPTDDVQLEKGQTWLSLSSPSEGTSRVTVLAPDSECWDQRKATATIYWVDARWTFPAPQRVNAGTPVQLLTRVNRAEGAMPARGWKVRYEILNPELASFDSSGTSVAEVDVDGDGNAIVNLIPVPGTSGNAVIDVQVIRPGGVSDNMPDLTLGRGQAFVTWSAPQLRLRAAGPEVASYNIPFDVFANLQNPGDQDATGVAVRATLPEGVRVLNTDGFAQVVPGAVTWNIGTVPAGQELDLTLQLSATSPISIDFVAQGDAGLAAAQQVRVDIYRPSLAIRVQPRVETIETGQPVLFDIEVENTGDRVLQGVRLEAIGDSGLQNAELQSREIGNDRETPLQPGEIWQASVEFTPIDPGRRCLDVSATAAGGQRATASACLTAYNPAPPTPAVTVTLSGRDRVVVGDTVLVRGRVINSGRVPLTNLRVAMAYDPQLAPVQATVDVPYVNDVPYLIAWTLESLAPDQAQVFELILRGEQAAQRTQVVFTTETNEGARGRDAISIQVLPGAPNNVPLSRPPRVPPASPAPSIPLGPAPGGSDANLPDRVPVNPSPVVPLSPRSGSLRMELLQQDLGVRVDEPIRYALVVINDTDTIDGDVAIRYELPPGIRQESLVQTTSPELGQFRRSGNTIEFIPIRTMKAGERIPYTLVLRSTQPQPFDLRIEAFSRNTPGGVAVTTRTEILP
ncbi:MAG: hypothetical protein AAGD07_08815 [Planctomycetota bacterium]